MLAVTVRFQIAPEHAESFYERVQQQAKDTLEREAACTQFDVCRSVRGPAEVFLYEIYDDESAFALHLKTPHFLAFDADVRTWVRDKTVEKWERA